MGCGTVAILTQDLLFFLAKAAVAVLGGGKYLQGRGASLLLAPPVCRKSGSSPSCPSRLPWRWWGKGGDGMKEVARKKELKKAVSVVKSQRGHIFSRYPPPCVKIVTLWPDGYIYTPLSS